ncbi:MAG: DNA translocase FtsK [Oscillospiraceae bacterium]|nr:DNA translocase FtsK [Oscillospiraceae bacterium]
MATRKKPAPGRKPAGRKNVRKKQKPEIDRVWSILLFGVGLLLCALTYIEGQPFWNMLRDGLFGLFGYTVYLLAPLVLFIAVLVAMGKPFKVRLLQLVILLFFISGAVLIFGGYGITEGSTFTQQAGEIWQLGVQRGPGGVSSILLGWPLLALVGNPGAGIIIVVLVLIYLMLLTNITPADILLFLRRHFGSMKETAKTVARESVGRYPVDLNSEEALERERLRRQAQEEKRALKSQKKKGPSIDVDLGPGPARPEEDIFAPGPDMGEIGFVPYGADEAAPAVKAACAAPPKACVPEAQAFAEEVKHDQLAQACLEVVNEKAGQKVQAGSDLTYPAKTPAPQSAANEVDELIRRAINGQNDLDAVPGTLEVGRDDQLIIKEPRQSYRLPSLDLLDPQPDGNDTGADAEMKKNAQTLVDTLESFGVKTRILDISRGPSVTRYELQPQAGVKISRITNLADDIALNLATAGVRIEAPIPGKPAVGIEVPNQNRAAVSIRSVLESPAFQNSDAPLTMALGKDISGQVQVADLAKMPHLLIAGTTGSGKSVCTNGIIISLLYRCTPEELKLILIDPKVVEFADYNGIPHLAMPVVTEPRKAAGALGSAVAEMEKRYQLFAENNVRDIKGYNRLAEAHEELEHMPYIVIVIDEMADLMMTAGKEVEDYICRLAQKARAAGMHLIAATQRPSVDVVTGLIKANIPSRIGLSLSSQVDSRTILDAGGAEKLLGNGDLLFLPVGANKPIRIQGAFVKDREIARVIRDLKSRSECHYNEEMIANTERMAAAQNAGGQDGAGMAGEQEDEMLRPAIEAVIEAGQASTSMLQRRLRLGYGRAGRLMDEMERMHIIGPYEGAKPRQVLITRQQWIEMNMNQDAAE